MDPGQKLNLFIAEILARKWAHRRGPRNLDVVLVLLIFRITFTNIALLSSLTQPNDRWVSFHLIKAVQIWFLLTFNFDEQITKFIHKF